MGHQAAEGDFVVFVKVVALPNTSDLSHYPAVGIRGQQQEFVNVYRIIVVKSNWTKIRDWLTIYADVYICISEGFLIKQLNAVSWKLFAIAHEDSQASGIWYSNKWDRYAWKRPNDHNSH